LTPPTWIFAHVPWETFEISFGSWVIRNSDIKVDALKEVLTSFFSVLKEQIKNSKGIFDLLTPLDEPKEENKK